MNNLQPTTGSLGNQVTDWSQKAAQGIGSFLKPQKAQAVVSSMSDLREPWDTSSEHYVPQDDDSYVGTKTTPDDIARQQVQEGSGQSIKMGLGQYLSQSHPGDDRYTLEKVLGNAQDPEPGSWADFINKQVGFKTPQDIQAYNEWADTIWNSPPVEGKDYVINPTIRNDNGTQPTPGNSIRPGVYLLKSSTRWDPPVVQSPRYPDQFGPNDVNGNAVALPRKAPSPMWSSITHLTD